MWGCLGSRRPIPTPSAQHQSQQRKNTQHYNGREARTTRWSCQMWPVILERFHKILLWQTYFKINIRDNSDVIQGTNNNAKEVPPLLVNYSSLIRHKL